MKGRQDEGTAGRQDEGTAGRQDEGTAGRQDEETAGRRDVRMKERPCLLDRAGSEERNQASQASVGHDVQLRLIILRHTIR